MLYFSKTSANITMPLVFDDSQNAGEFKGAPTECAFIASSASYPIRASIYIKRTLSAARMHLKCWKFNALTWNLVIYVTFTLLDMAMWPRLVQNYRAAKRSIYDAQCVPSQVMRVVAERKHNREQQYLVQWCGLPYKDCTWESVNTEAFMELATAPAAIGMHFPPGV